MGEYLITLDCGTTNLRAIIWKNGQERVSSYAAERGVSKGNTDSLRIAVRDCVKKLTSDAGIDENELSAVVAGGMISSNVGLVEIPHLTAPAGIDELASAVVRLDMNEITRAPIFVIPGVRNSPEDEPDMMRGEETETVAVLSHLPKGEKYLLVFPGSHMKYVHTNEIGQITACSTTLSGELLSALILDTILSDAVGGLFAKEHFYSPDDVRLGVQSAHESGLSRAAFRTRILSQFDSFSHERAANYLLGVVLEQDLSYLEKIGEDKHTVICGGGIFCRAIHDMLPEKCERYVPAEALPMSAEGALAIYKKYCELI